MLDSNRFGFAVMNKELTAISFDHWVKEKCIEYCRNGYVVAERIPKVCGFNLRITWHSKFYKPIRFSSFGNNILWLHFSIVKVWCHKTGQIVYSS